MLRAPEAAARHESFAKAADELGVTPSAVSHQVKSLEEWLGWPLFVRHAQGLHLTNSAHPRYRLFPPPSMRWAGGAGTASWYPPE